MTKKFKAFISKPAAGDKECQFLQSTLEKFHIPYYLSEHDNKTVPALDTFLFTELDKCNFYIPIITAQSEQEAWQNQEIGYMLGKKDMVIFPVAVGKANTRGYISHIAAHHFHDDHATTSALIGAFEAAQKGSAIDILINSLENVSSPGEADTAMGPLANLFGEFTCSQITSFAVTSEKNEHIWSAGDCATHYIPEFLETYSITLDPMLDNKLRGKIAKYRSI
ncbi:MAG: hypothetical protein ACI9BD_000665 [Candidatus Marinamargulisbacteria bacterium]|jgi:hypothetical protein